MISQTVPCSTLPIVLLLDWNGHYLDSWAKQVAQLAELRVFFDQGHVSSKFWCEDVISRLKVGVPDFQESFDLVILGHNVRRGLEIARLMPEGVPTKTVVVSHDPLADADRTPYQALGVNRFNTRSEIFNLSLMKSLVAQAA